MAVGDSKTESPGSNGGGQGGGTDWEVLLLGLLNATGTHTWTEVRGAHRRVAYGGYTMGQLLAAAPAVLDTVTAPAPDYILVNLGANDLTASPSPTTETDFKQAMSDLIDLLRSYYPNASIWFAKPWIRSHDSDSFTMGTWIAAVAASKNVNVGINENVWLKGADNGVTNTYDGIHYSGAGETACAAQWKAVLGL